MSAAQDGRARAIEAAREGIKRRSWESWGTGDLPAPEDFAEAAIDAALFASAVVTRDAFESVSSDLHRAASGWEDVVAERDALRELLVSAEGYALAKGADRPFACMFAADAPQIEVIERAGCYPRDARREHPGRFFLNPPPERERTS